MPLSPYSIPNAVVDTMSAPPAENPLETGVLRLGDASAPSMWYDTSYGPSYGNGQRFEHEEAPFMAKVPSKHSR